MFEKGFTFGLGPSLKAQQLIEYLQNLMIRPEGASIRQIFERVIAIRRLPSVTVSGVPFAYELRRYAADLQRELDNGRNTP